LNDHRGLIRNPGLVGITACSFLLGAALPAFAHHSFQAEYDASKPVTIKGTIKKLDWVNPHAYFWVEETGADGKVTMWAFETLSPNALARQGWNRNSLKPGESVTVEAYLAKDGKPLADGSLHANSKSVTRADGRKVFVGSSADNEAPTGSK
jgi:hypothetical protein